MMDEMRATRIWQCRDSSEEPLVSVGGVLGRSIPLVDELDISQPYRTGLVLSIEYSLHP